MLNGKHRSANTTYQEMRTALQIDEILIYTNSSMNIVEQQALSSYSNIRNIQHCPQWTTIASR
jgi:hypothetical protein